MAIPVSEMSPGEVSANTGKLDVSMEVRWPYR